jgi:hypothetical protein
MTSYVRRHLNPATLLALLALVFAMSGGAYAVTSGGKRGGQAGAQIAKKTHKGKARGKVLRGPRGPRGPEGKQGPAGPAGPAGPQGPKGENGAPGKDGTTGTNGTAGTNGVSATSVAFSGPKTLGSEKCEEGGLEVTSASGTNLVCNGKEGTPGSPWTPNGTLPANATETGAWAITPVYEGRFKFQFTPISFTIPLKAALGSAEVHLVFAQEGFKEAKENAALVGAGAPCAEGTEAAPRAAAGQLCVYSNFEQVTNEEELAAIDTPTATSPAPGAATTGAMLVSEVLATLKEQRMWGTWAVTG